MPAPRMQLSRQCARRGTPLHCQVWAARWQGAPGRTRASLRHPRPCWTPEPCYQPCAACPSPALLRCLPYIDRPFVQATATSKWSCCAATWRCRGSSKSVCGGAPSCRVSEPSRSRGGCAGLRGGGLRALPAVHPHLCKSSLPESRSPLWPSCSEREPLVAKAGPLLLQVFPHLPTLPAPPLAPPRSEHEPLLQGHEGGSGGGQRLRGLLCRHGTL